jgi:hypothetical protein
MAPDDSPLLLRDIGIRRSTRSTGRRRENAVDPYTPVLKQAKAEYAKLQ